MLTGIGYHSWKRLGDVTSSLFALGYHQQMEIDSSTPAFLIELRRTAFARAYSADKNISIFLGRPPRIHRKYCRFNLPRVDGELIGPLSSGLHQWKEGMKFDYVADTQWSALCAVLKEDILDLLHTGEGDERRHKAKLVKFVSGDYNTVADA